MLNIKQRVNEINLENPTIDDVKYKSIKNLYTKLKVGRKYKEMKRLKLIMSFLPSMITKNNYVIIERAVLNPDGLQVMIGTREGRYRYKFEEYAINKYPAHGGTPLANRYFLTDFYEYFDTK
jgi:hypothetical protein